MSEAAPGYRDRRGSSTPARARLAEATRHLIDAVLTVDDAGDDALATVATDVERLVEGLTGVPAGQHPRGESPPPTAQFDYLPRSPVVGDASPFAPPFEWEIRDGRALGRATLGAPYEGPPGHVHGGMIALIFDEILGMANIVAGHPAMTGTLTVKYRKPTPLHRPVEIAGWVERREGRRIRALGTMTVDGTLTAQAEGIFVTLTPEHAEQYFGRDPDA